MHTKRNKGTWRDGTSLTGLTEVKTDSGVGIGFSV